MKKILFIVFSFTCLLCSADNDDIYYYMMQHNENHNIISTYISYGDFASYIVDLSTTDYGKPGDGYAHYGMLLYLHDDAFLKYIDPMSYGNNNMEMWEFKYDETQSYRQRISADVYYCSQEANGVWQKSDSPINQIKFGNAILSNRLDYLIRDLIINEPYVEGKKFYHTLGNHYVKIEKKGNDFYVSSPFLSGTGSAVKADNVTDVTNGKVIELSPSVLTIYQNVYQTLSAHPEFSDFMNLMRVSGVLGYIANSYYSAEKTFGNMMMSSKSNTKKALPLFLQYNYTLYVPTNEAMQMAYAAGLPTIQQLIDAEDSGDEAGADNITTIMRNFVMYHLQNNSVFMDKGFETGYYKSLKMKKEENIDDYGEPTGTYFNGAPYKLYVDVDESHLSVRDAIGNTRNIVKTEGLYNIMASEYWGDKANSNAKIINLSSIAIHAIDGPLLYSSSQFTSVEE